MRPIRHNNNPCARTKTTNTFTTSGELSPTRPFFRSKTLLTIFFRSEETQGALG